MSTFIVQCLLGGFELVYCSLSTAFVVFTRSSNCQSIDRFASLISLGVVRLRSSCRVRVGSPLMLLVCETNDCRQSTSSTMTFNSKHSFASAAGRGQGGNVGVAAEDGLEGPEARLERFVHLGVVLDPLLKLLCSCLPDLHVNKLLKNFGNPSVHLLLPTVRDLLDGLLEVHKAA